MKKRWIAILLVVLCVAGVSLRIWIVNRDNEPQFYKTYSMNEVVPFEDDFFYEPDRLRSSYDIEVLSARVMTVEDYLDEIGKNEEELLKAKDEDSISTPYIYDVEVRIRNHELEQSNRGLNMVSIQLCTIDEKYQVDHELFHMLYPQSDPNSLGFRLVPNSEMEVHLPFHVLDYVAERENLTVEKIKDKYTYLLLSMYPVKKMIEIIPE